MLSYLRLLFVGSVLLIALGLFNEQNPQAVACGLESESWEQLVVSSALLPQDPVSVAIIHSPDFRNPISLLSARHRMEIIFSRKNEQCFHLAQMIVDEIASDLLFRKGGLIHGQSKFEIPS